MEGKGDGIILLHGILRSRGHMARLAAFLGDQGYRTLNLSYPSTRMPIGDLVGHIRPDIADFCDSVPGRVHFVGYSMGALVIRAYLKRFRPDRLGRVVMLGPPNKGSEVADFAKNWRLFRRFYGPAGVQLVTDFDGADTLFGAVDYEVGVIAGSRSIDPVSSYIIGKPSDGKVSIESTRLDGMADHIVIAASHTFFPSNRAAWAQTLHFLEEGRFK